MERSFSVGVPGTGNTIKLFTVSVAERDDVNGVESLAPILGGIEAAPKSLLLDLDVLGIPLDNVEGMDFGPTLPDGRQSLILVSDNNFAPAQFTQFLRLRGVVGSPRELRRQAAPQLPQKTVPTRRGRSHVAQGAITARPQPSQRSFAPHRERAERTFALADAAMRQPPREIALQRPEGDERREHTDEREQQQPGVERVEVVGQVVAGETEAP